MDTQQKRLAVVQRVYQEWAAEQRPTPDPAHARTSPSQYTEGIAVVSATAAASDDLQARTDAALAAAGLPVTI